MSDTPIPLVTAPTTEVHASSRTARVVALVLLALGCLPIANLLRGGESDLAFINRWAEWGYGTGICVGVAYVAVIFRRAWRRSGRAGFRVRLPSSLDAFTDWGVPALATVLYACVARVVFDGRPLLIDELVQVMQARLFAAGRLFAPIEAHREFFSVLHVVDTQGRVYSQFPPGGPAILAIGELLHATWLVGPVSGGFCVWLFARLLRITNLRSTPLFLFGTTLLFALAPFGVFMFASHMNHVTTLLFLLVAMLGLARTTTDGGIGDAVLCGLGLGVAASIRPLDALAFALPAAAWLLVRALQRPAHWREVFAAGLGVAVPFAAMMWVNLRTTGAPFLFGYTVLWGPSHGLGFHVAPWGAAHTPLRGLELLSLYVTRLQTYFLETPWPALFPAIGALWLTRRLSAFDRYLLASAILLGGLYFAYWHDGFFLGPRFVFPWLPVLVLLTARFPVLVRERFGDGGDEAFAVNITLLAGIVMAVGFSLPVRVAQYRNGLSSMRVDYGALAEKAGAHDALVFVRESWGAEIVARMWAIGVSRSAAAALYHDADACLLDRALRGLETDGVRGALAESRLAPLRRDSIYVRSSPFSPDSTERVRPGAAYDATCVARINDDRAGYALLPPLLLDRASGNVYARDLQARDSLLLARYPGRAVFLFRHRGSDGDAPFEWLPLRRDSLMAHWRSGTP